MTALRVFRDDSADGQPPRQTLDVLFQAYTLPQLEEERRAAATITEYYTHLRRWAEFWQAGGPRIMLDGVTDTLSVTPLLPPEGASITLDDLLAFRRWIGRLLPDSSNRTRNKHVQTLQAVLADAHQRGIVPGLLKVEPLAENSVAPKYYLRGDQMAALYRACDYAVWPVVNAPDLWRTLVVMFLLYGFRTQELVSFGPRHKALTWGQISWDVETPNPEGQAMCDHGWFCYTPQKQLGEKPQPLYLPLTDVAAAHLRAIRPRDVAPLMPVFSFPRCNKKFYPQWNALVQLAKLKPKGAADAKYLPKHLRKSCATMLNNHRLGLGELVMGHADRELQGPITLGGGSDVHAIHYNNPEQAIVDGLTSLSLPEEFRQIFYRKQRLLF